MKLEYPEVKNLNFWFKDEVIKKLAVLKHTIDKIKDTKIKNFYLLVFSELVRECSNTKNNEFKLYKMSEKELNTFNPDVFNLFFLKANKAIHIYKTHYYDKVSKIKLFNKEFDSNGNFDLVLTSPPYGDSKTTVAYGQFSTLSNEWLGIKDARAIDKKLMGGVRAKAIFENSLISDHIHEIAKLDFKRALEVSSFYVDLKASINKVAASSINKGGKAIYVVGNRMVKGVRLPTDEFIAECFIKNGFTHLKTYERALSNKSMPK